MAQVPIKPDLLRWAMEQARSSPDDLATATKRDERTVVEWLNGTRKPTKGDANALAKRLGRPLYFFLLPEPPKTAPLSAWYRDAVRGTPGDETTELNEVRAARRRQETARWALEKTGHDERISLPHLQGSAAHAAAELQRLLNWNTKRDQISVSVKNTTFKRLRAAVESLGVVVQLRPLGADNSRGFSLPDPIIPMIIVNSSHTLSTVRSFTLLHELAHLCRGEQRVCYERNSGVEAWCNRLAANYLMPRESLLSYVEKKGWTRFDDLDTDPVRLISNRYNTSWFSVAVRLNELGLAQQGLIDTVKRGRDDEFAQGRKGGGSGGEPYTRPLRRIDEFGSTYTSALLSAREAGAMSELEVRRQLRVNRDELAEVAYLSRTRSA